MTFGTHPGVDQDLRHGIASGWRFFPLIRISKPPNEIRRMVVGNVLQGVLKALDQILLGYDRHKMVPLKVK
jgi:hypothetical protein